MLSLIACSGPDAPDALVTPGLEAADPAARRGELLSFACQACHTLKAGEAHHIGPNLHGVFGRTAGTLPGFGYSDALRRSGIVWTPATLERWLAAPNDYLPGTTMVFTGYAAAADRQALLDYLVVATAVDSSP